MSEKEWTHHGLLLLPGLKQVGDWLDRERVKNEIIAEGRIDEVKVRSRTMPLHIERAWRQRSRMPDDVAISMVNVPLALVRRKHGLA